MYVNRTLFSFIIKTRISNNSVRDLYRSAVHFIAKLLWYIIKFIHSPSFFQPVRIEQLVSREARVFDTYIRILFDIYFTHDEYIIILL